MGLAVAWVLDRVGKMSLQAAVLFLANSVNWEDLPSVHHLVVPKIKMATPH